MYQIDGKEFTDLQARDHIYDLLSEDLVVKYIYSGGVSFIYHKTVAPWYAQAMYLLDDGIYVYGSEKKVEALPEAKALHLTIYPSGNKVVVEMSQEIANLLVAWEPPDLAKKE